MSGSELSESPVQTLLTRLRTAAGSDQVSVHELVAASGEDSFATLLFVVSLIMVTPLSGVPTAPTIGAVVIGLIVVQWTFVRQCLWLPEWIAKRSISASRFCEGLTWADPPAKLIDRHTRARLSLLVHRPLPLIIILAVVITWPFLEVLPFFTTVCAVGVALIAFGMMARDGLFVLAGYAWFAVLALATLWVI